MDSGVSEVIVTGVLFEEQDAAKECTVGKETGTGGRKVANLTVTGEKTTGGISSFIGASYSGTGDLFASVIAGGKARGDRTEDSVRLAGEMIEKAGRESAALGISGKEGAEYEKYVWMLCKMTKECGEKNGKYRDYVEKYRKLSHKSGKLNLIRRQGCNSYMRVIEYGYIRTRVGNLYR